MGSRIRGLTRVDLPKIDQKGEQGIGNEDKRRDRETRFRS